MPPEQTEEQRRRALQDAGLTPIEQQGVIAGVQSTISSDSLSNNVPSLQIPKSRVRDYNAETQVTEIDSISKSFLTDISKLEREKADIISGFFDLQEETSGVKREETQIAKEEARGIPELQTRFSDLDAQLKGIKAQSQALAIQYSLAPERIQQESIGRGRTLGGIQPLVAGEQRRIALQQADLASQAVTLQAEAYVVAGRLDLAQRAADRAVDLKFKPLEDELERFALAYQINKDLLDRVDKKRSEALSFAISERTRILGEQKADDDFIRKIGLQVAQFGGNPTDIFKATTPEEAMSLAGNRLQDPAARQQLENAKLDNQLKKLQIQQEATSLYYLKLYGGMSPKEYQDFVKNQAKENKELETETEKISTQIRQAESIKATLEGLVNHKGMTKAVGVYGLARFTPLQIDKAAVAEFTGVVVNIIDNLTLGKLIESKNLGATFGALSDAELAILANAATPINNWKKTREGGSIYFEISEEVFTAQLNTLIKEYEHAINLQKSRIGFSKEESLLLDSMFGAEDETEPLQFYNTGSTPMTL